MEIKLPMVLKGRCGGQVYCKQRLRMSYSLSMDWLPVVHHPHELQWGLRTRPCFTLRHQ